MLADLRRLGLLTFAHWKLPNLTTILGHLKVTFVLTKTARYLHKRLSSARI
jgi:hypothetical protein